MPIRFNEGTTLELFDKMRNDSSIIEEQYRCIIAYELAADGNLKAAISVLMAKGIHGLSPISLDVLARILIQKNNFKKALECLQLASVKSVNGKKYEALSKELEHYYEKRIGKILLIAKSLLILLWLILGGVMINKYLHKSNHEEKTVLNKEAIPFLKTYQIDSSKKK